MPATQVLEPRMNMPQIKAKARDLGVTPGKMKKTELIHSIQAAENCTACYGTSNGDCPQIGCCFRTDCFKVAC